MKGTNMCAMSVACEGKPADHGLLCAEHREEDRAIQDRHFSDDCSQCVQCREGMTHIIPCAKEPNA